MSSHMLCQALLPCPPQCGTASVAGFLSCWAQRCVLAPLPREISRQFFQLAVANVNNILVYIVVVSILLWRGVTSRCWWLAAYLLTTNCRMLTVQDVCPVIHLWCMAVCSRNGTPCPTLSVFDCWCWCQLFMFVKWNCPMCQRQFRVYFSD